MKTNKILLFLSFILSTSSSLAQDYSSIQIDDPKGYVLRTVHSSDSLYTPQQKQMVINDFFHTKRDSVINNTDSVFASLPGLWLNEYEWKLLLLYYGATDTTLSNTKVTMGLALNPSYRINKLQNLPHNYSKLENILTMYRKLGFPDRNEIRLTGNNERLRYKPKIKTDKAAFEEYNRHIKLQEEYFINKAF